MWTATVSAMPGLSTGIRVTVPRAATVRRLATANSASSRRGGEGHGNGEPDLDEDGVWFIGGTSVG